MQKCLGSFEQNSICHLLSFKSQKCQKNPQNPSVWGSLLSKTVPEVTAATLLFIWMSLNVARPQTNWKGSTVSVFANIQYSCLLLFSVILWYHWHQSSFICEYGRGMRKKNGQRYNTTFLSSGTSHNTV